MTQRVLILGATSAIAAEVARLYAKRGARLHLVARNPDKLRALVDALTHVSPSSSVADFCDLAGNERVTADAVAALGGLDVALIAHGDLGDQLESERSSAAAERVLYTNFVSVVSLLVPLANVLEAERAGCIGVITSVAGERGRPRNYTYGAAKGGLNVFLQGLRSRLYKSGVSVVTLKLGPVDTPMTRHHDKNLLFAAAPQVARSIVSALDAGKAEPYVPAFWGLIMPLVRSAPERLFQLLPFLSGR
ncbi:MAG TPA: SDR family NAD(P)-dependent oxidoreductase [Polyangiaceae bacterium]|nr:SDR family NAD(P)-dependent oxidoreductase [Polyangiaceae bacterium]